MGCLVFGWNLVFCVPGINTLKVACDLFELLCNFVRDVVIDGQCRTYFVPKWVQNGVFDSEECEPVLLAFVEMLLKPVGFIVPGSTGAEIFPIRKKIFHALRKNCRYFCSMNSGQRLQDVQ